MTKGRLTRQELSWLLAQEAQNAAERLRSGVQVLRESAVPADPVKAEEVRSSVHVDDSLDALDDVMAMLSSLHQRPAPAARRGRIDLAALVLEVAPDARVSIEPGSGTEVFGDELDFRRMVQVLVGHASGDGSAAVVRRDEDEVCIAVTLGPDPSPTADTERSWLSRMALRYGGRHELDGRTERLAFPADEENREREELRRELDHARKQGAVYARELAERDESDALLSSMPAGPGAASDRLLTVTRTCAAFAEQLGRALGEVGSQVVENDEDSVSWAARSGALGALARRYVRLGAIPAHALEVEVDLAAVVDLAVSEFAAEAADAGVAWSVDAPLARAYVRAQRKALEALVCELVHYAMARAPRGSRLNASVATDDQEIRIVVGVPGGRDPAPAQAVESPIPAQHIPKGLFVAAELAAAQGGVLTLGEGPGDAAQVTVSFTKPASFA